ncbi:hypothetical protein HN51_017738 [Arachis hypogaea]|uniref:probable protein phosphatase 2C 55 n=1 Tax=Arachis hypogaea TaxID=3818 RepID=UPI000DEC313B|nr:probable protein phosphatase 2C 55 [Arachis hypogaea]QHO29244.1 putative protein phosphatase 2C [Arachis hypogaea]
MPLVYFSRLGTAIQSSNVGIGGGTISSVVFGVLIAQGKLLFSTTKFCHPVNFEACTYLVRQRRTLSVIATPCPTVSTDSALTSRLSAAAISECSDNKLTLRYRRHSLSRKVVSNLCLRTGLENGRKVGMKSSWQPENRTIYSYLIAARTLHTSYLCTELPSRDLHGSSSCAISGPAHGVRRDTCACKENSTNSSNSSKPKAPLGKTLKLASGSCYLPHPDKEKTGGEDAHFICSEAQAIGLADGVGGWADHGVDAGQYSRELMSNSVAAISGESKGSIDPARVLEKAYLSTKAKGSSTACIITLTDQWLHAINLGDSGFMVIRDGCTVFRSPVQQHNFNFTYQLESGNNGDLPSSGQVFTIRVALGDVIVAGTDGLFDNLYNNDITAVVVHAKRAGLSPQATAQKIAALARQRAQDKDRQTPFSTAAQDAGLRYYGGKLDDTTVIVSYITGSEDA